MKPRIQFAQAEKQYYDSNGAPVDRQWKAAKYSVSLQRVSQSVDLDDGFLDEHRIDLDTKSLTVCIGREQGCIDSFRETFGIDGDLITISPKEFPEEETSLSRNHFMLELSDGLWTLSRGSSRGAEIKLQRWGRTQVDTLAQGTKIGLLEGDLLSCWSNVGDKYFWLLLQMTGDGKGRNLAPIGRSGDELRETDDIPAIDLDVSIDRLNAARKAAIYSFSEFLSWPMHPTPKVRTLSSDAEFASWLGEPAEKVSLDSFKKSLQILSERLYDARSEANNRPLRHKTTIGADLLDELMETNQLIPFILGAKKGDNVGRDGFAEINVQFRKRMIPLE